MRLDRVALLLGLLLALGTPPSASAQCSGQFPANTYCGNATSSQALPKAVPIGREKLTADRNYFVSTSGSDTLCNGLSGAASPGSPAGTCSFRTPQKGADVATNNIDRHGFTVSIFLTGAFTSGMQFSAPFVGSGTTVVLGSSPGQSITATNTAAISASGGAVISVAGNSLLLSTVTTGYCLQAAGGRINFSGVNFGACADGHISAGADAVIFASGDYTISGDAPLHWHSEAAGAWIGNFGTITCSGIRNFSVFFAGASYGEIISAGAFSGCGAATGRKFLIHYGGYLNLGSGNISSLPGDLPGVNPDGGIVVYNGGVGVAWDPYTVTVACIAGGPAANLTAVGRQKAQIDKAVLFQIDITATNISACTTGYTVTLPTTPVSKAAFNGVLTTSPVSVPAYANAAGVNLVTVAVAPANGQLISITGMYESQ